MNSLNTKTRFAVIGLVAVLAIPFASLLFQPLSAEDRRDDADVQKILHERLGVLQEAADLQREAFRSGTASFLSMLSASQAVLDAELELAKTAADRVRIREQTLKNAEELENATEVLVKGGEGTRMDLLSAKANRLRATADLMLERKSATP